MIKKSKDIAKEIDFLIENGNPKGNSTGFRRLDEFYTLKYGSFTIILAEPHSGKSEFGFELCLNQAERYGKRTLVVSPETGSVSDIYAELIHKYTGRPLQKKYPNALEQREVYNAMAYIDEMFSIVDTDERGYTYEEVMKLRTNEDIIFVDPNNEMTHIFADRQDIYIEGLTADIRRFCKQKDVHMIITMHPAKQDVSIDKVSGKRYFDMPKARMAAGGQAWFRKAMGWINMWRPPDFLMDVDGMPYPENTVLIEIEKAKPKGIGKKGTCELQFDWKRNRYSERSDCGSKVFYAFEHEKGNQYLTPNDLPDISAIQANIGFTDQQIEDLPF